MRILVLGSGVVGTAAAWYLARDGHAVTVLEAAAGPARETSFANAGHLAAASGPWADPSVPMKLIRWLGREDAPLLLRLPPDPALVTWGMRFLRNCTAAAYARNVVPVTALARLSVQETAGLRDALAIDDEHSDEGVLTLYHGAAEMKLAPGRVERLNQAGMEARIVGQAELAAVEPAIAHRAHEFAGGVLAKDGATADAQKFTTQLAARAAEAGVSFRFNARVDAIELHNGAARGVRLVGGERVDGDAIVLAAGPWSATLAASVGVRLPIYPGRGYSATIPIAGRNGAPRISVVDEHAKLYFTRFRDRLRVAGTLELNGFNPPSEKRAAATLGHLRRMYPEGGDFTQVAHWSGLRPMTPDGRPLLGQTRLPGLWVDAGHGPLGWTMAAGSARILADLVAGRAPALPAQDYAPDRFG